MYILKRILISLHSAVFPHKHFVKILLLYENPFIRQIAANNAFHKLQYQSQAGYLKNYGSTVYHEDFVPKTLFDFLIKYT